MRIPTRLALAAIWMCVGAAARADVVITMEAVDADMNPISDTVSAGTQATVDVLVSVDGADNPLLDLRLFQLNFTATSPVIQLDNFTWDLDTIAYGLQLSALPNPQAASLLFGSDPLLIVLDATPIRVAMVEITINGSGTLDARHDAAEHGTGAKFNAGFVEPRDFSAADGNLAGGWLSFSVEGDSPPDSDGDGTADASDAFPNDPTETTDTDEDGVGDNTDPDDDNDGVVDELDDLPLDPDESVDTDEDGIGDKADTDDDNDGVSDQQDAFPLDPNESIDTDADGVGDNLDTDDDNDGVPDVEDAFATDPTRTDTDASTAGNTGTRLCGAGMLGTTLSILCVMGFQRRRIACRP